MPKEEATPCCVVLRERIETPEVDCMAGALSVIAIEF